MTTENHTAKESDDQQPAGKGLDGAACSPSDVSDTPECDEEAFVATYDYWESCDVVRLKFAERLERERNTARLEAERWRRVAAQYAKCKEEHCNRLPWEPSWGEHLRTIKAKTRPRSKPDGRFVMMPPTPFSENATPQRRRPRQRQPTTTMETNNNAGEGRPAATCSACGCDPFVIEAAKDAVNTLVRENERLRDARAKAKNGECVLGLTVGMLQQDFATIREIIAKGGTAADILRFLDTPNA